MTEQDSFSNNLLDFDNFDPFSVSSTQKTSTHNGATANLSSSIFDNDPFGADDWQHAMGNVGSSESNFFPNGEPLKKNENEQKIAFNSFGNDSNDFMNFENQNSKANEKIKFDDDLFAAKPYDYSEGSNSQQSTTVTKESKSIIKNNANNIFNDGFEPPHLQTTKTTSTFISDGSSPGSTSITTTTTTTTTKALSSNLDDLDDDWLNSVKAIQLNDATSKERLDDKKNLNEEETKDFNKTTSSAVANNQTSTSTGATKASAAVTVTTTATTHKISGNKKKMDHSDDSGKFSVHSRYNNASSNLIIESDNGDDEEELQENKQPQSDKGLAGLKKMERNVEDDFVIKSKSPQQQPHKGREASEAAEKASAMIFNYSSSVDNMCVQCNKRVYEMEKITVDTIIYHKACFRCVVCGRMLSLGNYSAMDGQMYCKTDFMKTIKMKGSTITQSPEPSSQKRSSSEFDDEDALRSQYEEEFSGIPVKNVRSKFETTPKSQDGLNQRQHTHTASAAAAASQGAVHYREDADDDPQLNRPADIVVSSNVCVIEEELPPPSLAKNLRSMFENKDASQSPSSQQQQSKQQLNKTRSRESQKNSYNQSPDVVGNKKASSSSSSTPASQQPRSNVTTPADASTTSQSRQVDISTLATTTEFQKQELPPSGTARSLLERWRNIEEETTVSRRSRGPSRSSATSASNAAKRSQSSTRVEISERLKVVESDRPKVTSRRSRDDDDDSGDVDGDGCDGLPPHMMAKQRTDMFRDLQQNKNTSAVFVPKPKAVEENLKSFKWQVKEAVPLNRPCIVHGDLPKYLPVVGDVINEKTPISEIPKPRTSSSGGRHEEDCGSDGSMQDASAVREDVVRGSYVTEIKEEELPDATAVKSAMLRFKSMEDPSKIPPLPKKATATTPLSRYDPHLGPLQTYSQQSKSNVSGSSSNSRLSKSYDDRDDESYTRDRRTHQQSRDDENDYEDDGDAAGDDYLID